MDICSNVLVDFVRRRFGRRTAPSGRSFPSSCPQPPREVPYSSTPGPVAALAWKRASVRPIRRARRAIHVAAPPGGSATCPASGSRRIQRQAHPKPLASPTWNRPSRSGDLDHAEIHVRAEASIEAQLFLAVGAAALDGREVQKPQIDRLLELVGVRTRQDDPGAMRFVQPQVVSRRIEASGRKRSAINGG